MAIHRSRKHGFTLIELLVVVAIIEHQPRLEEARLDERTVFFVDAAHFVMGSFLGWVWCAIRMCVRAASGRQRYNVLGALNATTHHFIRVTNDGYITSTTVCELLQ